jgi:hypothetical protein
VCLCEGSKGKSIDEFFINRLMKSLRPDWVRPWSGSNVVRIVSCGGRSELSKRLPSELKNCLVAGGHTTLMVWADCDHTCANPDQLKADFWVEAQKQEITSQQFGLIVFIFARDRIENWIEFLLTGSTDESREGPRIRHTREASDAAKKLAAMCIGKQVVSNIPPSLNWSCRNWRSLVETLRAT